MHLEHPLRCSCCIFQHLEVSDAQVPAQRPPRAIKWKCAKLLRKQRVWVWVCEGPFCRIAPLRGLLMGL